MKAQTFYNHLSRGDTLYLPFMVEISSDYVNFTPVDLTHAESITASIRDGQSRRSNLLSELTLANGGIRINPENEDPARNDIFALRVEKSVVDEWRGGKYYADVKITFPRHFPESERITPMRVIIELTEET